MNALELHGVTKEYAGFSLRDVTLSLPMGCILGLIGENGAGKSTTIKLILDAARPSRGDIRVLGRDNRDHFRQTKEELGVVLDEANFPDGITVPQVDSIMKHVYHNWESKTYYDHIARFALPRDKAFKDFSRGMKMKLSIAVALSHRARLLILDEATSGLDPIVRDEILDLFYDFTRDENHAILISSHIVSDLEKLCDYIAFLHQGRLLFCEEKDRLLESYGLLACKKSDLDVLPRGAVAGKRQTDYGVEALVRREAMPSGFQLNRAGIEDIIVYLAKEERQS